jgi:periplasmic divalent cation tolerance protein
MRVVLCNTPPDQAERIARELVEAKLAACVNVIPSVTSVYRWKGTVQTETESTLLIKTSDARIPALIEAIRRTHPYEVPEIVALPVVAGEVNPAYAAWVNAETEG